ncbi:MAG TPA: BatA domain-containing protein, partial [Planctomycetaceae bacterium]|nr:BatA domain-containing protein [Planctomycetaceae bacterium]
MNVLNGGMLLGLATIVAPLLIHLFVRRSPPVVDWGAMQFLPSAQRAQRTIMLHDVWLLMLRIVVVALLVIALARPWVS